ncbi:uncharacterized protein LOC114449782 [Parambassis ranga]|uniref:Uncharacterized protein LOC114449782 n=1 Tax=Parambassis ranga TaxID=210632 RepID=A0A6P7K768_9TELE|nr:uncharacterized protein LOC114449782 [Parambassis ranga]
MLLLPAAALCCLCSALVAMETGPVQDDLTLTRRAGEKVSFSCGGADRCDRSWFFWYQKKETFRHVLGINRNDGQIISYPDHPQKDDFSIAVTESGTFNTVILDKLPGSLCFWIKDSHQQASGDNDETHYREEIQHLTGRCSDNNLVLNTTKTTEVIVDFRRSKRAELLSAELRVSVVDSNSSAHKQHPAAHRFLYQSFSLCAGWYYDVFGSGTTLIVTDERVVQPVLSVYPAASSLHPEGSSSLLCLASAMFPPLVRFSWRRQKENGLLEELPPAEGEQLELRESGLSASIRVLDRDALRSHRYSCYVEHEGGRVEAHTQQEVPAPAAPCPPEREPPDLPALQQAALSFQAQCRVRLLLLLYTVLIVKSLLYCCGLCLLMIPTFQGPSST